MKKSILYIIMAALLTAMFFSGCSMGSLSSTPVPDITPELTATPDVQVQEATATPTQGLELVQSDEPFSVNDFAALVGEQLSVDTANELFGEPVGGYSFMQMADGATYLCIEYQNAYIQFTDIPLVLAAFGGEVLDQMTDEDKAGDLLVNSIWMHDAQSSLALRGVGIGSSSEQVLGAFLNLSSQYTDDVLYTISDINPAWGADWVQSFVGGRILPGQDTVVPVIRNGAEGDMDYSMEPVDCDEVIEYTYINDSEDYPLEGPGQWNAYASVRFYIKDGAVEGIYLVRFTDPE